MTTPTALQIAAGDIDGVWTQAHRSTAPSSDAAMFVFRSCGSCGPPALRASARSWRSWLRLRGFPSFTG